MEQSWRTFQKSCKNCKFEEDLNHSDHRIVNMREENDGFTVIESLVKAPWKILKLWKIKLEERIWTA